MPFDPNDPRAALTSAGGRDTSRASAFAPAQFMTFDDESAHTGPGGVRSWFVRTENAAIAYSLGRAGNVFTDLCEASERFVAVPDDTTSVQIEHGGESVLVTGRAAAIVPAGPTRVTFLSAGPIVQMVSVAASDLLGLSMNSAAYRNSPPNVAARSPRPCRETRIRVHNLADYPPDGKRFGTIFRSTNLMINFIDDRNGPRDITKLSPHTHDDFEQLSIQLGGEFVHHVRTPWTPDLRSWREDEHVDLAGPGAVIFPPPMVHTSQATGSGVNRLIDAFAPPRADFLAKQGWVLNAEDYAVAPEPEQEFAR